MRILVVEDDKLVQAGLRVTFREHQITSVDSGEDAIEAVTETSFNLMFLDIRLSGQMNGLEVLMRVRDIDPLLPVIVMSGLDDKKTIVQCLENGAVDYLVKGSVNPSAYAFAVHKASVWRKKEADAHSQIKGFDDELEKSFLEIVGASSATDELKNAISIVGKTDGPFLIYGETGTGKELAAHAIWSAKACKSRPFIIVNCAEFQSSMIEGELFGYEKGAFTGASAQRIGLFEAANGGDIFLDEIGELPLEFQAKLLRVVQLKRVRRVGSNSERQLDFRVIAATNRDLRSETQKGFFRQDLLYRLDVHSLSLSPLRNRSDDIPRLLRHFFEKEGQRNIEISQLLMTEVCQYSWPGNVRQLISLVKFVNPLLDPVESRMSDDHWKCWLAKQETSSSKLSDSTKDSICRKLSQGNFNYDLDATTSRKAHVDAALTIAGQNQAAAARLLGISKQRLQSWLQGIG